MLIVLRWVDDPFGWLVVCLCRASAYHAGPFFILQDNDIMHDIIVGLEQQTFIC